MHKRSPSLSHIRIAGVFLTQAPEKLLITKRTVLSPLSLSPAYSLICFSLYKQAFGHRVWFIQNTHVPMAIQQRFADHVWECACAGRITGVMEYVCDGIQVCV